MSDNRNEYSFKNGAFIGFVLVNEPPKEGTLGRKAPSEEGWRFVAVDLRQVTHLSANIDHPEERTDLFHGINHIATVNCSAKNLAPHWLEVLHAFERIPTTKEAQAAIASMQIRGEEIPVRLQTHSDR